MHDALKKILVLPYVPFAGLFPQYTSLKAYLYANTIFIDIVDTHFKRENRCNIPLQKF